MSDEMTEFAGDFLARVKPTGETWVRLAPTAVAKARESGKKAKRAWATYKSTSLKRLRAQAAAEGRDDAWIQAELLVVEEKYRGGDARTKTGHRKLAVCDNVALDTAVRPPSGPSSKPRKKSTSSASSSSSSSSSSAKAKPSAAPPSPQRPASSSSSCAKAMPSAAPPPPQRPASAAENPWARNLQAAPLPKVVALLEAVREELGRRRPTLNEYDTEAVYNSLLLCTALAQEIRV